MAEILIGPGAGTGATGVWQAGVWVRGLIFFDYFALSGAADIRFDGVFGIGGQFRLNGESAITFEGDAEPIGTFAIEGRANTAFIGSFTDNGAFAISGESAIVGAGAITGAWGVFGVDSQAETFFEGQYSGPSFEGDFHVEAQSDLRIFRSPSVVSGGKATAGCLPDPSRAIVDKDPSSATDLDDPSEVIIEDGPAEAKVQT